MRDVLVVYATEMGSTREIAEAVGGQLRCDGFGVEVRDAAFRPDPSGYRAVVVGSALYLRRWRPAASVFLRRNPPRSSAGIEHQGPVGRGRNTPSPPERLEQHRRMPNDPYPDDERVLARMLLLESRLITEFRDRHGVDESHVRELIHGAYARFRDSRVREFVPILVERAARTQLIREVTVHGHANAPGGSPAR